MDLLIRLLLALLTAGCVSSEGDVLTSLGSDGAPGTEDAAADADPARCPTEPSCPLPPLGDVRICGRVVDLATSQPVTVDPPEVRIFDLVDLRLNPLDTADLARVTPDACGYFTTTVDGFTSLFAIHTGPVPPEPEDVYRRVTGVATILPGQVLRANAWVLRADDDVRWTSDAGLGTSFAEVGSVVTIFFDREQPPIGPLQGSPLSGVTVTASGDPIPDDDYYFDDAAALERRSLAPAQSITGANGSAVVRASATLINYSGDKNGCEFDDQQGVSIPGTVQVQEIPGSCN